MSFMSSLKLHKFIKADEASYIKLEFEFLRVLIKGSTKLMNSIFELSSYLLFNVLEVFIPELPGF